MKRAILVLLLLASSFASAQIGQGTPALVNVISGAASGGCTANSVLYANASTLLACGGSPSPTYDATNIRLQVGTGSTTQAGWYLGYYGSTGLGAIWSTAVTPSASNYAFASSANTVFVNGPIATSAVTIQSGSTTKGTFGGAAGTGLAITAGTATTDVQALSTTQTWNAAGVTFTGHKYTVTDTASAAGSLHSQWLGGAAGATDLMSVSKAGSLRAVTIVSDQNLIAGSALYAPLYAITSGTMTNEIASGYTAIKTATSSFAWTNAMVTALGAVTAGDILAATLPAKTEVVDALVVITGAASGPATVTVSCGRTSASYIDYIVASDAKAAANTVYGDASAERGTNLTGYDLPSYTGTTAINCHFISTGANLSTVTGSTGRVILTTRLLP